MKNNSFRNRNRKRKPTASDNSGFRSNRTQNKKKASSLNPAQLIKKAEPIKESPVGEQRKFESLDIHHELKQRILTKGFVNMTPIQDRTIEDLIAGRDVMGIANTGSGKTGAFLIPVIHNLMTNGKSFQTLILVPTRELALQVEEEFRSLTKGLGLFCASFIGGTNINSDIRRLQRNHHVIVGTPGRINDLMNRNILKLHTFSTLILDEFDRMLDMGFIHDVTRITDAMRSRKQTILFSATIDRKQDAMIGSLLDNPVHVKISSGETSASHIEQDVVKIREGEDKFNVLLNLIRQQEFEKVLIFAETKRGVSKLTIKLKKSGVYAEEIHGNKSQSHRQKALNGFRTGRSQVLVATDVASRGIDVDNVTHVINYQIPLDMQSYVHRIGRTGRAGKTGKAITLID